LRVCRFMMGQRFLAQCMSPRACSFFLESINYLCRLRGVEQWNQEDMSRQKNKNSTSTPPADDVKPGPIVPQAESIPAAPQPESTVRFPRLFALEDWITALVTTIFSGCVFFYYMAPEVTLQDSGELVTGAFTFGVPHPPGYPLWAFLGFVWSHLIVPCGNPAWRLGTMSVFTGALAVGIMTLMMTSTTRLLLRAVPFSASLDSGLVRWIAVATGASSALLFGFNRGVWLWACVSEMRSLNVFSFMLTSCLFMCWMLQPGRRGFLLMALLTLALSLANHQTIGIMVIPFGVGAVVVGLEAFFRERKEPAGRKANVSQLLMTSLSSAWELAAAGLLSAMVCLAVLAWLQSHTMNAELVGPTSSWAVAAGIGGALILATGLITGWWRARRAFAIAGLFLLGVSFYAYMPLAAATNPPMNWGYAATAEGFLHAIGRGQYEQMHTANLFSAEFFLKFYLFGRGLIGQYSVPLILVALVGLVVFVTTWRQWESTARSWTVFVWAAFVATSLGLLTVINPKLDRQEQEIVIKFFAPAHGFYAMLIGYGIAFLIALMAWKAPGQVSGTLARVACVALFALPIITYQRNLALCGLRGHDFGYQFGYRMFVPGGGYEDMDKNAVLYGGTDPGRFVPTYMIYCESAVAPKDRFHDRDFDRSDVYIITQNALADSTYMSYIRDQYDYSRPANSNFLQRLLGRDKVYPPEPIFIPTSADNQQAFQQYINDVQLGRIPAGADTKVENGRVSVQGVGGVMAINGILAKQIFDKNKDKHSFYVEESYVIPWMYQYLRPAGIIMKLEKDPIPSPQENPELWKQIVEHDRKYWDTLASEFLAREDFRRNMDAKKTFSKLRCAIAGLYAARGLIPEAEEAFKQSLKLCPESPESSFRLADIYMRLRRYSDARDLIANYGKFDEYNSGVQGYLGAIDSAVQADARRTELERQMASGGQVSINTALELAQLYQRFGMEAQFMGLAKSVVSVSNLPPDICFTMAQLYRNGGHMEEAIDILKRGLVAAPGNWQAELEMATIEIAMNKTSEAMASLRQAIRHGGEQARNAIMNEPHLAPLRAVPEFQTLMMPAGSQPSSLDNNPLLRF
jgi:tetratricopeptide (TPR) repeat protein